MIRRQFLIVATTRPETMLGDTAVAVHPEDHAIAISSVNKVRLPLTTRADSRLSVIRFWWIASSEPGP